jgi:hypothetical protein
LAYALDSSTNLVGWAPLVSMTNQTGILIWTNSLRGSDPAVFFRAREL